MLRILELLRKSYLIPVRYEFERIMDSTHQTNFTFVHNKLDSRFILFQLINCQFIYTVNLLLSFISISFYPDINSIEILDSCVVLIFNSRCIFLAKMWLYIYMSLANLHENLSWSIMGSGVPKPKHRLKGHWVLTLWFILCYIVPYDYFMYCLILCYSYRPPVSHLHPPNPSPLTRFPETL